MIRQPVQGDLGRAKALGVLGASLLFLTIIIAPLTLLIDVPTFSLYLVGIIALALAFRELSKVYFKPEIWTNFAVFAVLSFIVTVGLIALAVFIPIPPQEEEGYLPDFVLTLILAMWVLDAIAAFFFARATGMVAAESGVGLFKLSGLSVLAGTILIPVGIGGIIVLLGFIILALGFTRLEPRPVAPPFRRQWPPPSAPPVSGKTW